MGAQSPRPLDHQGNPGGYCYTGLPPRSLTYCEVDGWMWSPAHPDALRPRNSHFCRALRCTPGGNRAASGNKSQQDIAALTELQAERNCPPRLGSGPRAQRKGHPLPLAGGLSQIAVKPNKQYPTSANAHTETTNSFLEKRLLLFDTLTSTAWKQITPTRRVL